MMIEHVPVIRLVGRACVCVMDVCKSNECVDYTHARFSVPECILTNHERSACARQLRFVLHIT